VVRRESTRDLRQLVAMLGANVTELKELVLESGQACFERGEPVRGFDSLALELLRQLADSGGELLRANAVRSPEQTH
jgi:transposase